jgi:GSH-dependent disulfide-bond oxidoreductase
MTLIAAAGAENFAVVRIPAIGSYHYKLGSGARTGAAIGKPKDARVSEFAREGHNQDTPNVEERMIDLYYWPTPNGHKITMFLEEAGLDYEIHLVDISEGDQFKPDFLQISPNNRMPAIVDRSPADGKEPISVFESGAILLYLSEKIGKLIPGDVRDRAATLEWLFWQVGGLGPMAGQNHHFGLYAPEKIPYAIDRYVKETNRLYGVLDRRLADRDYIVGKDYSIADIAAYPWVVPWKRQRQDLDLFPNLRRWFNAVRSRPSTLRAYAKGEPYMNRPAVTEEGKKILFGQTAQTVSYPR